MREKLIYKQVDYMRKLVKELGRNNKNAICKAYAKAEDEGVVGRKNIGSWEYANRLYNDGYKKDWF